MNKSKILIAALATMALGAGLISFTTPSGAAEQQGISRVKSKRSHIYQLPTVAKLSQLYWALGKFEIDDDDAVDNFMRINECDIYKDYHHNEFEWDKIRDSGRKFLVENEKHFPTRFEFLQPLRLSDYDMKTKSFNIWDKYVIDGVRSFEVLSKDMEDSICGSGGREIADYPRGLSVELSRPFSLSSIAVPQDLAQKYILEKAEIFKNLKDEQKTQKMLYQQRDAYLVMQVRIFNYKETFPTRDAYTLAKVLAVLESYDVYADRDRKTLLYSENVSQQRRSSGMEKELKAKYQERLKRKMEQERQNKEPAPAAQDTTAIASEGPKTETQ